MNLKEKIKELAEESFEQIRSDRRHLHQNPELSFKEYKTADFIEEKLKNLGLNPVRKAETGLVAVIEGKNPEKNIIALRGDIDALPIKEQNDVSYKSSVEGVMHACGHDVHTASLLGAAKILTRVKDEFEGTIKLIFQPGEESLPGGASLMIKDGALENPKPEAIFGQHVMPLLPVGTVGFRKGMYMASADEIRLRVKGKGGHGAMPEMNVDPVLIASHIIVAMQQIVSRNCDPKVPSVLSFGKVIADGATNVIPEEVYVEGTFRTLNEEWRFDAHKKIKKIAEGIAESMGGSCEVDLQVGYPFLKNDEELTSRAEEWAVEYMGRENVKELDVWMAAEDFAYYSQEMKACFYRLGIRNEEKGITSSVHTPTFDIDEEALKTGAGLLAWLAVKELGN
ncbi:M20 metallopeptidase family protein [Aureibacter tunicatorum]|uniref:Amidohydrolase n=1 Tax=Aureibacter tunicatorum TaxID=866807 RepID=A0AAE3XIZ7_9BACT|nr:M20 family metallopeptidase [Aureibacter tunicatorum]MDR6237603.1 amidohydrolase [Aureibacter tunicatorum]BDD02637.1 N-acyl-L-amino acid amidohydrolase [Aureibacter tunicatorum]